MSNQSKALGVLVCEFGGLMLANASGGLAAARQLEQLAEERGRSDAWTAGSPLGVATEDMVEDMAIVAFAKIVFSLIFIAAGFMLLSDHKQIPHKACIPARFIGMRPPGSLVWGRYQVKLRSRK